MTNESQLQRILAWCSNQEKAVFLAVKEKQIRKFEQLQSFHRPKLDPKRVVKNISNRVLSAEEEDILALGLNFATTPTSIPNRTIIAATESTCKELKPEGAEQLRAEVSKILQRAKPPKPNIDKRMKRALADLRKDDTIVILKADKGNATVVMNREEYRTKMLHMLDDPTYKKLKSDPTQRIEKKITTALKIAEAEGGISKEQRQHLSPRFSTTPQIYGLPKIHKAHTPLRPIVSSIGSPTYNLAKELGRILTPLTGKTDSFVKNASEFVRDIRGMRINEETIMVSFDVVSLFTKVPIQEAMKYISELLHDDETLEDRTNLTPHAICSLTEMCLRTTYFLFENDFFEQIEGAAMGSPLSPIVANLYMESLEKRALETTAVKPTIWRRYVDDTFVLWPHGSEKLEQFHKHLNSQHPQIQFTKEVEGDSQISFLDVLIKKENGKLTTMVYRKPTDTGRYTHFSSHHHPKVKSGTVRCLAE